MNLVASRLPTYALITAARNEAALIDQTLRSVVGQRAVPVRWVIVSDGSTDGTDEIVKRYARIHPWIELHRLETGPGRDFSRKVRAFNAGLERLGGVAHDIIGSVDADVSFDEDYFEFLLQRFAETPDLGVAGTCYLENGRHYDFRFSSVDHVSGFCQLFRRQCFDAIGGFVAVADGGEDCIAATTARMMGWKTRTFVDKAAVHGRALGSASGAPRWKIWLRQGERDYAVGNLPQWEVARSIYQSTSGAGPLAGILLLAGYARRFAKRVPRPISDELMQFHRREQALRLRQVVSRLLRLRRPPETEGTASAASLTTSLARLQSWVEDHDYKGYEPFDGLSSPLRRLTFGNRRLEQVLLQIGRQSPVNLRPLLGVPPLESTKGRGYMAWGYLARFEETGDEHCREKAIECLGWLIDHKSPLYAEHSWGNHFDYASRAGRTAKHESTIVWTGLIGQAFLDAYEILRDQRYLDIATSICRWILKLPRERTARGACLSYLAMRQSSIHNSNLLGAALLARTAKHTGIGELLAVATAAVEYSCSRQLADGAWYYGEEPTYHWIDCFHTGYNLDSIKCYLDSGGDQAFRAQLDRGYRYFKRTFIEPGGRPRYYHNRAYPIDIQCAAQAIETLTKFSADDREALPAALAVARWTVESMQDPSGYFYYRRFPLGVARIPMFHWGQATMYRALALLSLRQSREAAVRRR